MRIAITGGTGFIGRHLSQCLIDHGHKTVLIARGCDVRYPPTGPVVKADLSDVDLLAKAFVGCDAIAHLAGINRELGSQTYPHIHVEGTRNVIRASRLAGVQRILFLSFLRARPNCGSAYHESKFIAEELLRRSALDYTILKAGVVYGRGDHMLNHLSCALNISPFFATVGFRERPIRPLAVDDLIRICSAVLTRGRMSRRTVFVLGPEALLLSEVVRQVAMELKRPVWVIPAPIFFHRVLAAICESLDIPLISRAQVKMLTEGFTEPAPVTQSVEPDLEPRLLFTANQIRGALGLD